MCFFQVVTFEMFTSEPRLKGDYYQPGETDEQYRKRQTARQRAARVRNLEASATPKTRALRKVAEQRVGAFTYTITQEQETCTMNGSGLSAQMTVEWTRPHPYNLYCEEIPEELEPYEFWDEWRYDIEAICPNEPDLSNPPEE